MGFYQQFSKYYDAIFPLSEQSLTFLKTEFKKVKAKEVLDIGTGTGNYALALAKAGFKVKALDLDEKMLKQGVKKSKEANLDLDFIQANMLELNNYFPEDFFQGIFCIGNVLVHLTKEEELLSFLKQVYNILTSSGVFILQIINYDRILEQNIKGLPKITNQKEKISFTRAYEWEEETNLINFKTSLSVEREEELKVYFNVIKLKPLLTKQLKELFQLAGFQSIQFFANFAGEQFRKDESLACVVRAKK